MKAFRGQPKIILAGAEIAGHYTYLKDGFTALGVEADLLTSPNAFDYGGAPTPSVVAKTYAALLKKRMETPKHRIITKLFYVFLFNMIAIFIVPFWAAYKYDVVFFAYAKTFSDFLDIDLFILKHLNIKMFFTFHGSDARPDYINGATYPLGTKILWDKIKRNVRKRKKRIRKIEKNAHFIMAYPAISHFFSKKLINSTFIGNPLNEKKHVFNRKKFDHFENKSVIILHCPSAPSSKGSHQIKDIIANLQAKGLSIEYRCVHGVPNGDVLYEISKADILIDSLWNDTPEGTFPAEGAFFGKPVVIGSYLKKEHPNLYKPNEVPPFIFVAPEEVEDEIERLVCEPLYRKAVGEMLLKYMYSFREVDQIAQKYLDIINGEAPEKWWIDPYKMIYLRGYGAPEGHICELVLGMIDRFGVESLQLGDKPELENAFLMFARQ